MAIPTRHRAAALRATLASPGGQSASPRGRVTRFSVVIPTYNRRDLLPAAIDSVLGQSYPAAEVIVADDGSTDGTAEVVERYGGKVTYLRQPNGGPGVARNLGLRHAHGDYVAFLDSDDVWLPWTLEVYASVVAAHENPAFVLGAPAAFREPGEVAGVRPAPVVATLHRDFLATCRRTVWYGTASFVVRKDVLDAAGGFVESRLNGEDLDLALRLGTAPGCVVVEQPVTFAYRLHPDSVIGRFDHTLAGMELLIEGERRGRYPGGPALRRERLELVTRFTRPPTLEAARRGLLAASWRLYRRTFGWHVRLGRVRFLAAYPALALLAVVRGATRRGGRVGDGPGT